MKKSRGRRVAVAVLFAVALVVLLAGPTAALAKGGGVSVVLNAPLSVAAGTNVTVSVATNPMLAGQSVTLFAGPSATSLKAFATKQTAGRSGKVNFSVPMTRNTYFYAVWNRSTDSLRTHIKAVKAIATLTVKAELGTYVFGEGTPIVISGTLTPGWCSGRIMININRVDDGTGADPASAHLYADLVDGSGDFGTYMIVWSAPGPGTYEIKAQIARRGNIGFWGTKAWTSITL